MGLSANKCLVSTLLAAAVGLAAGCGQSERRHGADGQSAASGGTGDDSSAPGGKSGSAPEPSAGKAFESAGQAGRLGAGGFGGAGTGGTSAVSSLPTCLTDLFAACWPEGACHEDTARSTVCYDSGVRVVSEPLVGGCFDSATLIYHAADGSVCFVHSQGLYMSQACESYFDVYYDAANTVIASATGAQVTCVNAPTVPCDVATGHCAWPTDACTPGNCPD